MSRSHPEWRSAARQGVFVLVAALIGAGVLAAAGDKPLTVMAGLEATQSSVAPVLEDPAPAPVAAVGVFAGETVLGQPAPAAPVEGSVTTAGGAPAPAVARSDGPASAIAAVDVVSPVTTTATSVPPTTATSTSSSTSTSTTTSTTAPARSGRSRGAEADVVPLTNTDRLAAGLGALSRDACLDTAAAGFAEQMAGRGVLAHNAGAGPAVAGCRSNATWGDNVGMSTACDTAALEREWMASPGHRRNILTGAFTVVGVGAWTDDEGACWVQVLFSS